MALTVHTVVQTAQEQAQARLDGTELKNE